MPSSTSFAQRSAPRRFGVERILASPLNVGGGTVTCAHGVMPVPAPATLELLKGVPVYSGDMQKELVTPTGAAIVQHAGIEFRPTPIDDNREDWLRRRSAGFPRALQCTALDCWRSGRAGLRCSRAITTAEKRSRCLEANLDDLNPQIIGYACERLLAEGALDVFTTAVQMKKSRARDRC